MGLDEAFRGLTDFVREHQSWGMPIVFLLAFAESLAFLSLLVPAWGMLVAIGALIGASGINFWPIWLAASLGAACGDWLSYWFGHRFKTQIEHMWPLSQFPDTLAAAERFVQKWGIPSVFIGRFSGPLRATVPLVAGVSEMPYWQFQFANFASAFLWAAVLLAPGMFGVKMIS